MSRGKLYALVGSMGVMAAVAAVALTLVFSQGGSTPAGSSPEPVASAVGLAQASGETVTSGGVPAAALPQGGTVSESGLEAAAKSPEPSSGVPSEGIKVHGHWTIEVREPDGTLVSKTEFENALVPSGRQILALLLGRGGSTGLWQIGVGGNTAANHPCEQPVGTPSSCKIAEPSDNASGNNVFKVAPNKLTVTPQSPDLEKTKFAGSFVVQRDGNVALVETATPLVCSPTVAPANCLPGSPGPFGGSLSVTTLATFVSVVTGQQVLVTVTFSFA